MRARSKLTPELIDMVGEMRERGCSYQAIANRLASKGIAVKKDGIASLCLARGFDLPALQRRAGADAIPRKVAIRAGREIRPFSKDDDQQLRSFDREGLSYSEMARRLGRNPGSVRNRLLTLARHDARRESMGEMAHG